MCSLCHQHHIQSQLKSGKIVNLQKEKINFIYFFKSLQNSIVCSCPNPQEPRAERSNLISQGTDITIWYQFSIPLLLFRNCFSCSRKRALPGSHHRAQGALAARWPHVTAPSPGGTSPTGTTPRWEGEMGTRDGSLHRLTLAGVPHAKQHHGEPLTHGSRDGASPAEHPAARRGSGRGSHHQGTVTPC